jgi:hypothetical protein
MKTTNELIKEINDLYLDEMTMGLGMTRQRLIDKQRAGKGDEPQAETEKIMKQVDEAKAARKRQNLREDAMMHYAPV